MSFNVIDLSRNMLLTAHLIRTEIMSCSHSSINIITKNGLIAYKYRVQVFTKF